MRACALTLLSFQGSAIIKRYVFATIQPLGRQAPAAADHKLSVADFRSQLGALMRDLVAACRREFKMIQQVCLSVCVCLYQPTSTETQQHPFIVFNKNELNVSGRISADLLLSS